MYTFRDGVFCTKDTVAYYYVMVLLMIILNSIFSWLEGDMEPCLSLRIWIGKDIGICRNQQLVDIPRYLSEWAIKCFNFQQF